MKNPIFLTLLFSLLISCKENKAIPPAQKTVETKKTKPKLDWAKLENDVNETISSIERSNDENRKALIQKFIGYHNQVDGVIAESYAFFAFNYIEENPKAFFSVLTAEDTALIKQWGEISISEVLLEAENDKEKDDLLKEIKENHSQNKTNLNEDEVKLLDFYSNYLMQLVANID